MEPWMIVFFPIMIGGGLFAVWLFGGWVCNAIAEPFWARKSAEEAKRAAIEKAENNQIKKYNDLIAGVEKQKATLDEREEAVKTREENISHLEYINKDVILAYEHLQEIKQQLSTSLSPVFGKETIDNLTDALSTPQFVRGMDGKFTFATNEKIVAKIRSGDHEYTTSLIGCTCPAKERPCKHMMWLAGNLGFVRIYHARQSPILARIYDEQKAADKKLAMAREEAQHLTKTKRQITDKTKIVNEKQLDYPWLARLLAQYDAEIDDLRLRRTQATNARLAQEQISAITKEKQAILKESLTLRHRQTVYEHLFPWLKIVQEANISPDDAARIAAYINEDEDYVTFLRRILTPEEYTVLSPTEKFMCALEYCRQNKPPQK